MFTVNSESIRTAWGEAVKVDGVFSGNAYTKRICGRLDRNVANKTVFEYLYSAIVECFST